MAIDAFQTPSYVAKAMLEPVQSKPQVIADFAVGDGALLIAATTKWKAATLFGTDLCLRSVRRTRKHLPNASIGVCNFLNGESRSRSSVLRSIESSVALVALNPPFSCRGASTVEATLYDHQVRCSVGLAFVINAIPYLCSEGEIAAILPGATMYSVKDELGWDVITNYTNLDVIGWNDRDTSPAASLRQ